MAAGKARSCANALKHGLTGVGIALPGEDAALVAPELEAAQEDFAPTTRLGAKLVRRAAILSIRPDRSERYVQAADHAAAPELALFEADRDAELARRYEQATARALSRSLRDFGLAEALAAPIAEAEAEAVAPTEPNAMPETKHNPNSANEIGPMASFGVPAVAPTDRATGSPPVGDGGAPAVAPARDRRSREDRS